MKNHESEDQKREKPKSERKYSVTYKIIVNITFGKRSHEKSFKIINFDLIILGEGELVDQQRGWKVQNNKECEIFKKTSFIILTCLPYTIIQFFLIFFLNSSHFLLIISTTTPATKNSDTIEERHKHTCHMRERLLAHIARRCLLKTCLKKCV